MRKMTMVILSGFMVLASLLGASRSAWASTCGPPAGGQVNCTAANVTQLNQTFATADADTLNTYNVYLNAGTYNLTQSLELQKGSVNLFGDVNAYLVNAAKYVLDGGNQVQPFVVYTTQNSGFHPYLNLVGLTVQNGHNPSPVGRGGCIQATYGEVDLDGVVVQNCHAVGLGGGIDADGGSYVQVYSSLIQNNYTDSIKNGTCGGGAFTSGGGVAVVAGGYAQIQYSAIIGNQACRAGGLDVEGGTLDLENSTVAENTGISRAGALRVLGPSNVTLLFNTIVENSGATKPCNNSCSADPNGAGGIVFDTFANGAAQFFGNIVAYNTIMYSNNTIQSGLATLRDCDSFNTAILTTIPGFEYSTNVMGRAGSCQLGAWWGVNTIKSFGNVTNMGLNHIANATLNLDGGEEGTLPAYKPMPGAFFLGQFGLHNAIGKGGNASGSCPSSDERIFFRDDYGSGQCDVGAYELNGTAQFN
jgi:hypothetical protein